MKRVGALVLLCLAAAGGSQWIALPPPAAYGCTVAAGLPPHVLESTITYTPVIAVGTFQEADADDAIFVVEDAIRGPEPGSRLIIDNRRVGFGGYCEESIGRGPAFTSGQRGLALFEFSPRGGSAYRVSRNGNAFYPVDGQSIVEPNLFGPTLARVDEVMRVIRETAMTGAPPLPDPGLPFCHYGRYQPGAEGDWTGWSALVVRGRVAALDGDAVVVEVQEVLKGDDPGASIRVNNRNLQQASDGSCRRQLAMGTQLAPGDDALLFLVEDEFDIADWRPGLGGTGILMVKDERASHFPGHLTLSDLRAAAQRWPYQGPAGPPRDGDLVGDSGLAIGDGADDDWRIVALAGAGGALLIWIGLGFVLWRRGRAGGAA